MEQINVEAARVALAQLTSHAHDCPCAQTPVAQGAIEAYHRTVQAAFDELVVAQPIIAMFGGRSLAKRGDEICIYATADDVAAIRRAVRGRR